MPTTVRPDRPHYIHQVAYFCAEAAYLVPSHKLDISSRRELPEALTVHEEAV